MNAAMILAGGQGSRFGGGLPKQYIEVLGKPILAHTLEVFEKSPETDAIQVVCQKEYFDRVSAIAEKYKISKLKWITEGGNNCPASIQNGVNALRGVLADSDSIIMHMSVSPLVSQGDIAAGLAVCREKGCCFTMHPVNICMAQRDGDGWTETDAPKEKYIELNSPWTFRYGEVYRLYRQLEETGQVISETDYTLNLWLADGRRAWYTRGDPAGRLKITTQHDMDMFEAYLMLKQRRKNTQGETS